MRYGSKANKQNKTIQSNYSITIFGEQGISTSKFHTCARKVETNQNELGGMRGGEKLKDNTSEYTGITNK